MNQKQLLDYESPSAELINLSIESGIMTVSGQHDTIDDAVLDNWGDL